MTSPTFIDTGEPGTWAEALSFPHSFQALDYANDRLADRDGLALFPDLHNPTDSGEMQRDPA